MIFYSVQYYILEQQLQWVLLFVNTLYVSALMWRQPPTLLLQFQNSLFPKPFREAFLLSSLWLQWKVGVYFPLDENMTAWRRNWNEVCLSNTKTSVKNRKFSHNILIILFKFQILHSVIVGAYNENIHSRKFGRKEWIKGYLDYMCACNNIFNWLFNKVLLFKLSLSTWIGSWKVNCKILEVLTS